MLLTDTAIRSAKPQAKPFKLLDGGGLHLIVTPTGGKWWRWKYRFGGKAKGISFGVYPEVSLKSAREKRDAARKQGAAGVDPGVARKAEKLAQAGTESFEAITREWHAKFSTGWAASHGDRILRRLENDIFPWLGKRPIAEIKAPEQSGPCSRVRQEAAKLLISAKIRFVGEKRLLGLVRRKNGREHG